MCLKFTGDLGLPEIKNTNTPATTKHEQRIEQAILQTINQFAPEEVKKICVRTKSYFHTESSAGVKVWHPSNIGK